MSFSCMGKISNTEPSFVTSEIITQYMEETMKCPHLEKWVVSVCKAKENLYVPSNFQLHEYCRTQSYRKCPFLLRNVTVKKERELVIG